MSTPHVQEPPFCIQVELTEGCNLLCNFCGLQGIRAKPGGPFKFMTVETANAVAASIAAAKWTARIEMAMHGEPSLNPERVAIVKAFRKHLPRNQLMMTSNGGGLLKDPVGSVYALIDAGLNILALDNYDTVNIVPKILAKLADSALGGLVRHYPQDGLHWSPHRRHPAKMRLVVVLQDLLQAAKGSHAVVTNHCGCGAPPNETKAGQRCAKPFREMGVRWDGEVAGCCNDWRGIIKVGNAAKHPVTTLWQGAVLNAMRRKLYAGQRDFGACKGCDYVSYRNGLLPDKLGKQTLPAPTVEDVELLRKNAARQTLSPIVFRPWEKKS